MRQRVGAVLLAAWRRAAGLWWVWLLALFKQLVWDRVVEPINDWIDKSALPVIPQVLRAVVEVVTAVPGLGVIVGVIVVILVLSYWETRSRHPVSDAPPRPGPEPEVDVTLTPSTGTGTNGVPDARITVGAGATGGRFSVRGRIVGYANDPNFVPTADYTLPWADGVGEMMEIRPHDERSVRIARVFDDHKEGLAYLSLLAASNTYLGDRIHHRVRWDPREATQETLPSYQVEIRVYLDGSGREPKRATFSVGTASQRGPARVTKAAQPSAAAFRIDALTEQADRIIEGLKRDQQNAEAEESWRAEAMDFLTSEFPDYLTDFKTARDPAPGRLSGAHVDDIWRPLRRMTAQLDVLREIRRELRKKQV